MTTRPRWRNGVRQLTTVHDLNFYDHPEWTGQAFRWWLTFIAVPAIKKADYVTTISDYVLADVRRTLRIPAERSARIYNGLTPLPAPEPNAAPGDDGVRVILGAQPSAAAQEPSPSDRSVRDSARRR